MSIQSPEQKRLEDRLTMISANHPWKSLVCVTLEYYDVQRQYSAPEQAALDYIAYKYEQVAQQQKPTSFILWYTDQRIDASRRITARPVGSAPFEPDMTAPASPQNPHKFP